MASLRPDYSPSFAATAFPWRLVALGLVIPACIAVGYAASHPIPVAVIALAAAGIALAVVAAMNQGALLGLLVVAVLNGLPFVDLEPVHLPGGFPLIDLLVVALITASALIALTRERDRAASKALRPVFLLSTFLIAWWAFTLFRTYAFEGVPLSPAMQFGRDYLYFGILVPLLALALHDRRDILGVLTVLGAATVLVATGVILNGIGSGLPAAVVHPHLVTQVGSVSRLYLPMTDAIIVGVTFGVGIAVLTPRPGLRFGGAVMAGLCLAATAFSLTRAFYLALPIGLVAVGLIWASGRGSAAQSVRRTAVVVITISIVAAVSILLFARVPDSSDATSTGSALGTVTTRVAQTPTELQHPTGTLAYRYHLAGVMFQLLDGQWPIGLGFVHPAYHYVPDLPSGTIRNPDVGFLNSLMTMGAVGTIALYSIVVAAAVLMARARHRPPADQEYSWIPFSSVAWLLTAVVGSLTLVTLHSTPGLVLTATIIGIGLSSGRSTVDQNCIGEHHG